MTLRKTDINPREKGAMMSSVLCRVRKRKKGRTLGPVDIIRRVDYAELELDAKVELIRSLGRTRRSVVAVSAVTKGRWAWWGSVCRLACRGFTVSREARFRCDPTRRATV